MERLDEREMRGCATYIYACNGSLRHPTHKPLDPGFTHKPLIGHQPLKARSRTPQPPMTKSLCQEKASTKQVTLITCLPNRAYSCISSPRRSPRVLIWTVLVGCGCGNNAEEIIVGAPERVWLQVGRANASWKEVLY
jgi:hypothetical protein